MATKGLGTLAVYLTADTGGLNRGLSKAGQMIGSFKGLLLGALGVGGVGLLAKQSIEAYGIQERNEKKLGAVLKATGYAAGFSLGELKKYASELQNLTEYGDEANLTTMGILATFRNIKGDMFKDATAAALDMATVLGQSADSAAMMIGKALNDPAEGISKLSRSGVMFSKEQEDSIKKLVSEGKIYEAQLIMLKELQMEFGGAAKAAAESTQGRLKQLSNAVGDLKEGIGAVIVETVSLGSTANGVTSNISGWASYLRDNAAELGFMFQSVFIDFMAGLQAIWAFIQNAPFFAPIITGAENANTMIQWFFKNWVTLFESISSIIPALVKDSIFAMTLLPKFLIQGIVGGFNFIINTFAGMGKMLISMFADIGDAIWKAITNPAKTKETFALVAEQMIAKAQKEFAEVKIREMDLLINGAENVISNVSKLGKNKDEALQAAGIEAPKLKDIEFGSMSKVWDEWAKIEDNRLNKQAGLTENYLAGIEKKRKEENDKNGIQKTEEKTIIPTLENKFAKTADTALAGSLEAYRAKLSGQENIAKMTLDLNKKIAKATEKTADATEKIANNQFSEADI